MVWRISEAAKPIMTPGRNLEIRGGAGEDFCHTSVKARHSILPQLKPQNSGTSHGIHPSMTKVHSMSLFPTFNGLILPPFLPLGKTLGESLSPEMSMVELGLALTGVQLLLTLVMQPGRLHGKHTMTQC